MMQAPGRWVLFSSCANLPSLAGVSCTSRWLSAGFPPLHGFAAPPERIRTIHPCWGYSFSLPPHCSLYHRIMREGFGLGSQTRRLQMDLQSVFVSRVKIFVLLAMLVFVVSCSKKKAASPEAQAQKSPPVDAEDAS